MSDETTITVTIAKMHVTLSRTVSNDVLAHEIADLKRIVSDYSDAIRDAEAYHRLNPRGKRVWRIEGFVPFDGYMLQPGAIVRATSSTKP